MNETDLLARYGHDANDPRALAAVRKLTGLTDDELQAADTHTRLWLGLSDTDTLRASAVVKFGRHFRNDPDNRLDVQDYRDATKILNSVPRGGFKTSVEQGRWSTAVQAQIKIECDEVAENMLYRGRGSTLEEVVHAHMRYPLTYWLNVEELIVQQDLDRLDAYDVLEEKWGIRGDQ